MSAAALTAPPIDLDQVNRQFTHAEATQMVSWAHETFGDRLVMTSSFGAQSAVLLHLATQVVEDIPVVFIDTGFHFPETYRFVEDLTQRLSLNLRVYQSPLSPARMTALYGRLWEQGQEGLDRYDRIRKIEPNERALRDLGARGWLAGLRREQTEFRKGLLNVQKRPDGIYKIHPILSWTTRDVHEYLKAHDLPYHPMYEKGYRSIGDWHSTRSTSPDTPEREGRFLGLKQECGLHIPETAEEDLSRESSGL